MISGFTPGWHDKLQPDEAGFIPFITKHDSSLTHKNHIKVVLWSKTAADNFGHYNHLFMTIKAGDTKPLYPIQS
jgi:hypothetical protein